MNGRKENKLWNIHTNESKHIFTQVNERATATGNVATATMYCKSHNQNVGERKI